MKWKNARPRKNENYTVEGAFFRKLLISSDRNLKPHRELWQSLAETGLLERVDIIQMEQRSANHSSKKHLFVSGFISKDEFDDEARREKVANLTLKLVLKSEFPLQEMEMIRVQIKAGYNAGIARLSYKHSFDYDNTGQPLHEK